jgi:hypothetical protein
LKQLFLLFDHNNNNNNIEGFFFLEFIQIQTTPPKGFKKNKKPSTSFSINEKKTLFFKKIMKNQCHPQ